MKFFDRIRRSSNDNCSLPRNKRSKRRVPCFHIYISIPRIRFASAARPALIHTADTQTQHTLLACPPVRPPVRPSVCPSAHPHAYWLSDPFWVSRGLASPLLCRTTRVEVSECFFEPFFPGVSRCKIASNGPRLGAAVCHSRHRSSGRCRRPSPPPVRSCAIPHGGCWSLVGIGMHTDGFVGKPQICEIHGRGSIRFCDRCELV